MNFQKGKANKNGRPARITPQELIKYNGFNPIHFGVELTRAQWKVRIGVGERAIQKRLDRDHPIDEAMDSAAYKDEKTRREIAELFHSWLKSLSKTIEPKSNGGIGRVLINQWRTDPRNDKYARKDIYANI